MTPGALLPPRGGDGQAASGAGPASKAPAVFLSRQEVWFRRSRMRFGAAPMASAAQDEGAARENYGWPLETTGAESEGPEIEETRDAVGRT